MGKYVEFDLSDERTILVETGEREGGVVKASIDDLVERSGKTFGQAVENAREAALIILSKLEELTKSPDEVEVTFGLKASGELKNLVVAKAGAEASFSVKLTWKKD